MSIGISSPYVGVGNTQRLQPRSPEFGKMLSPRTSKISGASMPAGPKFGGVASRLGVLLGLTEELTSDERALVDLLKALKREKYHGVSQAHVNEFGTEVTGIAHIGDQKYKFSYRLTGTGLFEKNRKVVNRKHYTLEGLDGNRIQIQCSYAEGYDNYKGEFSTRYEAPGQDPITTSVNTPNAKARALMNPIKEDCEGVFEKNQRQKASQARQQELDASRDKPARRLEP